MQYGKPFPVKMKQAGPNVYGDVRFAYEYDNQMYNAQFEPVDANGKVMPLPPAPVRAAEPQPEQKPSMPPATDDGDDDTPEDEKEIDLRAWADGTVKYAFNVVQAEIARIWDITDVKSKAQAVSIILEKLSAKT